MVLLDRIAICKGDYEASRTGFNEGNLAFDHTACFLLLSLRSHGLGTGADRLRGDSVPSNARPVLSRRGDAPTRPWLAGGPGHLQVGPGRARTRSRRWGARTWP